MESRSLTALLERWNLAIMICGFQLFQVLFGVKILANATVDAFLDGCSQKSDFSFIFLQPAKPCPNNLTGVIVPALKDAVLDKLLIMRA